jgi:hypothetical protein
LKRSTERILTTHVGRLPKGPSGKVQRLKLQDA